MLGLQFVKTISASLAVQFSNHLFRPNLVQTYAEEIDRGAKLFWKHIKL